MASSNSSSSSSGIGFMGVLAIVFIVLKLTNKIDWSWWWVTAPIWAPMLIFVFVVAPIFFIFFKKITR